MDIDLVRKSTDQTLVQGRRPVGSSLVREEGVEPPQPFGHRVTAGYPLHVVCVPGCWGAYGMYLSCPSYLRGLEPPRLSKVLHFSSTLDPLNSRHILNIKHDR
jgi:hypothetical protein